jgi:hypothetical protein
MKNIFNKTEILKEKKKIYSIFTYEIQLYLHRITILSQQDVSTYLWKKQDII